MFNSPHAPSAGLSGTLFSTLKRTWPYDPERWEIYNNTEVKCWAIKAFSKEVKAGRWLKTYNWFSWLYSRF
jgi:hypothetical protein